MIESGRLQDGANIVSTLSREERDVLDNAAFQRFTDRLSETRNDALKKVPFLSSVEIDVFSSIWHGQVNWRSKYPTNVSGLSEHIGAERTQALIEKLVDNKLIEAPSSPISKLEFTAEGYDICKNLRVFDGVWP
jgi:ATP-dependent protease HslVU (ClpYQ) ATPase subunit